MGPGLGVESEWEVGPGLGVGPGLEVGSEPRGGVRAGLGPGVESVGRRGLAGAADGAPRDSVLGTPRPQPSLGQRGRSSGDLCPAQRLQSQHVFFHQPKGRPGRVGTAEECPPALPALENFLPLLQAGPLGLTGPSHHLVGAFAAPHHHAGHGDGQQDGHCDEWDENFVWGVLPVLPVHGAVLEEPPVDPSDEALRQGVGPVAAHHVGLHLGAVGEALVVPAKAEGLTAWLLCPSSLWP